MADDDHPLTQVVTREVSRLRRFIRSRLADRSEVEDVLQDVFAELVEANRRLMPIEHVTAWLFRVARNRITDLLRKKRPSLLADVLDDDDDDETRGAIEDLLPSPDAGPDAALARALLLTEIEAALAELPPEQRDVFVAHEIEGISFKALAARTGVSVNTLLSRKRYAVLRLRARLRAFTLAHGEALP